jgi:hypothetical protein
MDRDRFALARDGHDRRDRVGRSRAAHTPACPRDSTGRAPARPCPRRDPGDDLRPAEALLRRHALGHGGGSRLRIYVDHGRGRLRPAPRDQGLGVLSVERVGVARARRRELSDAATDRTGSSVLRRCERRDERGADTLRSRKRGAQRRGSSSSPNRA